MSWESTYSTYNQEPGCFAVKAWQTVVTLQNSELTCNDQGRTVCIHAETPLMHFLAILPYLHRSLAAEHTVGLLLLEAMLVSSSRPEAGPAGGHCQSAVLVGATVGDGRCQPCIHACRGIAMSCCLLCCQLATLWPATTTTYAHSSTMCTIACLLE